MTAKPEDLLRDLRDETDRDTYAIMKDAVDLIEELLAHNRQLLAEHVEMRELLNRYARVAIDAIQKPEEPKP